MIQRTTRHTESSSFSIFGCWDVFCSFHLGSWELSTFPDSSKQMLFFWPPSVICTVKPVGAKILIRSTWVLGATGHYMIKFLNNTPAEFKSESLDCNCQCIHQLSMCWINIALPVTKTCQDTPIFFFFFPSKRAPNQEPCPGRLWQALLHTISHTCFCLHKFAITFPPGLDWLEHSSFSSSCCKGRTNTNQLKCQNRSKL